MYFIMFIILFFIGGNKKIYLFTFARLRCRLFYYVMYKYIYPKLEKLPFSSAYVILRL